MKNVICNEIKIKLSNGDYIVAQLCEYGKGIPPEISIFFQDENGVVLQDIALVRAKEVDACVVDSKRPGADVLVWADESSEDYTNRFSIDEYE